MFHTHSESQQQIHPLVGIAPQIQVICQNIRIFYLSEGGSRKDAANGQRKVILSALPGFRPYLRGSGPEKRQLCGEDILHTKVAILIKQQEKQSDSDIFRCAEYTNHAR